jgi:hypothetical protein
MQRRRKKIKINTANRLQETISLLKARKFREIAALQIISETIFTYEGQQVKLTLHGNRLQKNNFSPEEPNVSREISFSQIVYKRDNFLLEERN